jgi:hypothetical protein
MAVIFMAVSKFGTSSAKGLSPSLDQAGKGRPVRRAIGFVTMLVTTILVGCVFAVPAQAEAISTPQTLTATYTYDEAGNTAHPVPRIQTTNPAESASASRRSVAAGARSVAISGSGTAAKGAAQGEHFVFGLEEHGLVGTAEKIGAKHFMGDSTFRTSIPEAVKNPANRFSVSLDGLKGEGTLDQVGSAISNGLSRGNLDSFTNWEISLLYRNGRLGDTTFYRGGSVVPNPFN